MMDLPYKLTTSLIPLWLEVFDWELVIGQREADWNSQNLTALVTLISIAKLPTRDQKKKENRKEGKEVMTNITKVEF